MPEKIYELEKLCLSVLTEAKDEDKDKDKDKDEYEDKDKDVRVGRKAPHAPALDDVLNFCRENRLRTNPQTFWNHYQAVGWCAGGRPIRDWQAKLREWEARGPDSRPEPTAHPPANPALNYVQRDYPDDDSFYVDLDAYAP